MRVIFIGCIGMSPKALLDQFKMLTPGASGEWGGVSGVTDIHKADIVVVLEGLPQHFHADMLRGKQVICIPLEPPIIRETKNFPPNATTLTLDRHPFVFHFLGFLNPKITYNELKALPAPAAPKPKRVCIISSNIKLTASHIARYEFIKRLVRDLPGCDLFGYGWGDETPRIANYKGAFGNGYRGNKIKSAYAHKLDVLKEYQYVIVIENCRQCNYFTEKLTDVLLGWSYPIYYGAPNAPALFPKGSLTCIDIKDYPRALATIRETIRRPPTANMMEKIAAARDKILDEYNIWPVVARAVKG